MYMYVYFYILFCCLSQKEDTINKGINLQLINRIFYFELYITIRLYMYNIGRHNFDNKFKSTFGKSYNNVS